MLIIMYIQTIVVFYTLVVFFKYFAIQFKISFYNMASRSLWNSTSDESFHSDVVPEIDFMYSIKESENKDAGCIFCSGKFSEDERGEIWIKSFSCSLWAHPLPPADNAISLNL